jgi:hypothetical protein
MVGHFSLIASDAGQAIDGDLDFRGIAPESWLCIDCNVNTAPGLLNRVELENAARELGEAWKTDEKGIDQTIGSDAEVYTVRDAVWKKAGMGSMGGCLCIGCLEKRLGRRLKPKDFQRNDAFSAVPGTQRLLKRQGRRIPD